MSPAQPPQLDLVGLIVGTLASGTVAAAIITVFFNRVAEKRQHRLNIQREMLSVVRNYGEKYYFHLFTRAGQTLAALRKIDEGNEWPYKAFQSLTDFLHISRTFSLELETYFLGNLCAEKALTEIDARIFNRLNEAGYTLYELAELPDLVAAGESFSSFVTKAKRDAELRGKIEKFRVIVQLCGRDLERLLECYSKVLVYEINSIFAEWYHDSPPSLERDVGKDCLNLIRKELELPNYGLRRNRWAKIKDAVDVVLPP